MMKTIDMPATGNNIKQLLQTQNLTVADVQQIFGFATPQAIYKWLRGTALPTMDNMVILADVLDKKIDDILVIR